jgi:ubiquinone/menaquinone biosynthesis C-methylase UbiE
MSITVYSIIIDPVLSDVRLRIPGFSGMKPGDKVLDVCCGTGAQVFHYSELGINAIGIDLNSKMINIASRKTAMLGLKAISFKIADATDLPFKDDHFDFASISFALHDKETDIRAKVIDEMKRVVRREGTLIITDFRIPFPQHPYSYLIKSIEFLASGHYKEFKDYYTQGGLEPILEHNRLIEEKKDYLKSGTVVMIKVKNV